MAGGCEQARGLGLPLRVLIVEDSEDDMLLMLDELERGGYAVQHARVETAETMRRALESRPWDIVLSDYEMPRFSGPAAIELLRGFRTDLPFIVVTGAVGEKTAVGMIKAGADDYVMKDGLTRLVPAVEGALREAAERRRRQQAQAALEASERKHRQVVESLCEGLWEIDADGLTTFVNPHMADMLGYTAEDMMGKHLLHFVSEDWKANCEHNLRRRAAGIREVHDFQFVRKDGSRLYARLATAALLDGEGRYAGAVAGVMDITDRLRIEQQLRQSTAELAAHMRDLRTSEARYRTLVEEQEEAVCRWLPDTTLTYVNEAYCRFFGRSRTELEGRKWLELVPAGERPPTAEYYEALARAPRKTRYEHRVVAADGSVRWQEWIDCPVLGEHGRLVEFQSVGRDVTERRRAEEELRGLATRLESAREEERTRISREIHDELGQTLLALKMELSMVGRQASGGQPDVADRLAHVLALADRTILAVRRICTALRPSLLDDMGLGAALEWQAQEFTKLTGIRCQLELARDLPTLPDEVATALFRTFQETLTNAAQHSGASEVGVSLTHEAGTVALTVRDNGRGLPPAAAGSLTSLGLVGIRERARRAGGEVRIEGKAGEGTTVRIAIPAAAAPNGTR